jgi:TPR repeat protein
VLVVLAVAAAVWWKWNGGPDVAGPAAKDESGESLESVRRFLASNPEPAAARAKGEALAANGKALDAQFLLIKYAAERGDPVAARMMGTFYDPNTWSQEKSPLPAPNPLEAARWHKMAAEAGDAESQYRYGMLLRKGNTDEPNGPELAIAWLRKAAAQGNADAKKALEQ